MIPLIDTSKKRKTTRNQTTQHVVKLLTTSAIILGLAGIFYLPALIGALILFSSIAIHFVIRVIGYVNSICCEDSKYSISLEEIIADLDRANG